MHIKLCVLDNIMESHNASTTDIVSTKTNNDNEVHQRVRLLEIEIENLKRENRELNLIIQQFSKILYEEFT